MKNYFKLYEYASNFNIILVIYHLPGKAFLQWEGVKIVHVLEEKTFS